MAVRNPFHSTMNQSRVGHLTKLGIEGLEERWMKAGDVFVCQDAAGYIRIFGDSSNNQVVVAKESSGSVTVESSIDTRLNGMVGATLRFDRVNGISADLGAGVDSITVKRLATAQPLAVEAVDLLMAEDVAVYGVQANQLKINAGPNASNSYITEVVANQVQVDTGGKNDGVFIANSKVGFGGLRADTRAGNDHIQLFNTSVFGKASIRTDGGNDRVELLSTTPSTKTIDQLYVALGDGNDIFYSSPGYSIRNSNIDGGTGFDQVVAYSRLPARPTNFEMSTL